MAQNVMTGFMQGYQWADDMQRRQLQDERQAKLDTQAQQDRTRRIGMEDEVLGRQRKEWDDKDSVKRFSSILYKLDEGGLGALTDEDRQAAEAVIDPQTKATLARLTKTPDDAKAALGHIDQVFSAMSGQGGDYRGAIDSANVLLADYINQGQGGTEKRIKDVLPSQGGRGFYLDLEMKDEKGNFKTAPMTKGRGTADTDPVSEVDGAEMMQALGLLKKSIEARLVELGDSSPLERKRAQAEAQAAAMDDQRKFVRELAVEKAKAEINGPEYKTFGSPDIGYYSFNPQTGEKNLLVGARPVGGMSGGGSGGYGGRLPAEAQLIEYYKSQGKSFEEAMSLAKQAKENPRVWAAKYYQDLAKSDQESAMMYGTEPTPPDELLRQAQDAAAMLFGELQKRPMGGGMAMMPSHGSGATSTAKGQAPAGPVPLDKATAMQILQEAGGDKAKARAIALERGFAL